MQLTFTPTPKPPAATPTQAFTLAASAEEIVGTWVAGSYYIRFDTDGTFRQADALDKLEYQFYAAGEHKPVRQHVSEQMERFHNL